MRFQVLIAATAALLTLAACASQKVLEATGGSRSDGTVKLSFEYGMFQKPVVDWDQANASATQRCAAWGYSAAEKFDAGERKCEFSGQYGCERWEVTVTYQCTGHPS
ncbi:MAG TPA: YecR family lipoprotein [Rhizomicrobium sp.]|jgi:hypothetical protein|nr:YecR family lipoprotein [Rhizomicrobium sp.]